MLNNRICYLLSLKCVSKFKLFGSCEVNIYLKCFGYECVGLMSDITVLCKKKCAKRFIIDGDELKTFTIILMISNQIWNRTNIYVIIVIFI